MRYSKIFRILEIDWFKTILFNFHYLSFSEAIKLPILVCSHTKIAQLGGRIIFEKTPLRIGLLKIGFQSIGFQDGRYDRTVWQVSGDIYIRGCVNIGRGSKICVMCGGEIFIDDHLVINGSSTIICAKSISFGKGVLISWGTTIMDTDFHCIRSPKGSRINNDSHVEIGDNVWIGMNCQILKGTIIPSNSVIAAGSLLSGVLGKENCIYGTYGRIIKDSISWTWN